MTVPQRLTERKREAILQAAIAEFRSSGFEITSMDKIAATAGVSKRTVYNHFPSKEELFAEILNRLWNSITAEQDMPYSPQKAATGAASNVAASQTALAGGRELPRPGAHRHRRNHSFPERAQDMVSRMGQREEGLTAWIRQAQADGRLKPVEPAFAAQQMHGLLKTFAFWPQVSMGQPSLTQDEQAQVIESALDMFLSRYQA